MIIAYSKHGKKGKSVTKYLDKEQSQVLEGDPQLTQELINSNKNKLKYRSGIIAFEGKKPSQEIINDVISEFKKSTFAGMEEDQYNLLMVEHTDTDNYHIHFVIPRQELTTGKSFNPHYYKEDQKRLLLLQNYLNSKHNLSNPFEMEKRTTIKNIDLKSNKDQIKQQIHEVVTNQIIEQKITNRDEIISFFEASGIEVSRKGKDYITVNLDDEKYRLKGDYYAKTFTNIDKVTESIREAERRNTATTHDQFRKLEQEYSRFVQFKTTTNRAKYPKREQDYNRESRLRAGDVKKEQTKELDNNSSSISINRDNRDILSKTISKNSLQGEQTEAKRDRIYNKGIGEMASSSSPQGRTREWIIPENKQTKGSSSRRRLLYQNKNKGEIKNDSTRNTALERIRAERERQQRAYAEDRKARIELHRTITERSEKLREQYIESIRTVEENSKELSEQYRRDNRRTQETASGIQREYKQIIQESEISIRTAKENEPKLGRLARLGELRNKLTHYISSAREYLKLEYNKCVRAINECKYTLSGTSEHLKETYKKEDISFNDLEKTKSITRQNKTYDREQNSHERSQSYGMSL